MHQGWEIGGAAVKELMKGNKRRLQLDRRTLKSKVDEELLSELRGQ